MTIGSILVATVMANLLASWASMKMRHWSSMKRIIHALTHNPSRSPPRATSTSNKMLRHRPPQRGSRSWKTRYCIPDIHRIVTGRESKLIIQLINALKPTPVISLLFSWCRTMLAISSWAKTKLWSARGKCNVSNTEKSIVNGRLAVASTSLCFWMGENRNART